MTSNSIKHIEQLFLNSYTDNLTGWNKVIVNDGCNNPIQYRSIRIGTQMNCNGDIIKDPTTIENIQQILQKHNIEIGLLNQIDNNIEFSVELCLIEKEYNKLIDSLLL